TTMVRSATIRMAVSMNTFVMSELATGRKAGRLHRRALTADHGAGVGIVQYRKPARRQFSVHLHLRDLPVSHRLKRAKLPVARANLTRLEQLPNVGPSLAGSLRMVGVHTPADA